MAEERIEEHEHVIKETDEGTHESERDSVVERDVDEAKPKVTTIEEETVVRRED